MMKIKYRSWKKDYFTSALPWTQRGNAASVPLGTSAPLKQASGAAISFNPEAAYDLATDGNGELIQKGTANYLQYLGGLYADLSQASGMTINSFRRAMALQKWLERNAIGGSRYIEQILSHFGIRVPDYKLARPVYLGGGKYPITVSEVLQTSQSSSSSPQANMAGHGLSAGLSNGFQYLFPEHGFVMCLLSIMPKAAYFQGLSKMFTRESRYDYFCPEFAHLGEQEVRESEVYNQGTNNDQFSTMLFGYQSRYAEYKSNLDEVHGDLKASLRYWHCGRKFDTLPELEEEFSVCGGTAEAQSSLNNIFAVTDPASDHFIVDLYHDLKAIRPMPKYGTPSI